MTIRQRVLDTLQNFPGQSFTNRDLSVALKVPEPSVRRATLTLETQGRIKATQPSYNLNSPLLWCAVQVEQVPTVATT
jgi:DNA-binding IclR family transcriptional regulator